jgi:tRNA C32,U32 (ribose-2'-O)-methylase TrmJ
VPPPVYPSLQVTVTVSPVLPEIEPAADLSELATAAAVHAEEVLQSAPLYPALQSQLPQLPASS